MARVFIPVNMRRLTDGLKEVQAPGATLGEVVEELERRYPGIRGRIVDGDHLQPGLAAVIDGEPTILGLLHKLEEETEVYFLPALEGGSR